uniref:Uncharacterized protein n=1 Tax=Eptatretus burgeri TaxID=7764 RepID=A0A8C4NI40_EPTBU
MLLCCGARYRLRARPLGGAVGSTLPNTRNLDRTFRKTPTGEKPERARNLQEKMHRNLDMAQERIENLSKQVNATGPSTSKTVLPASERTSNRESGAVPKRGKPKPTGTHNSKPPNKVAAGSGAQNRTPRICHPKNAASVQPHARVKHMKNVDSRLANLILNEIIDRSACWSCE